MRSDRWPPGWGRHRVVEITTLYLLAGPFSCPIARRRFIALFKPSSDRDADRGEGDGIPHRRYCGCTLGTTPLRCLPSMGGTIQHQSERPADDLCGKLSGVVSLWRRGGRRLALPP